MITKPKITLITMINTFLGLLFLFLIIASLVIYGAFGYKGNPEKLEYYKQQVIEYLTIERCSHSNLLHCRPNGNVRYLAN